ncbi:Hypothetical protein FKW44_010724 [Caligus rogercresseyi]|uniref:Uncharacterized protein n=1 Tax=Caligus rogercresseyi TaxID=217165 RepID=A0A7T8K7K6_CALRO|nr:Hypothetical protein FKW44_010724 [Caligus rogercresseyi]
MQGLKTHSFESGFRTPPPMGHSVLEGTNMIYWGSADHNYDIFGFQLHGPLGSGSHNCYNILAFQDLFPRSLGSAG